MSEHHSALGLGPRPIDPATGDATAAAGRVQVSVEEAVAALDARAWALVVAAERSRAAAGTGAPPCFARAVGPEGGMEQRG